MAERVVVSGTVVGQAGAAVAGWVQLGQAKRRWISEVVRIFEADGRERTITHLGDARFEPVTRRTAPWHALESDELARLCIDDAPGPDVEVELATAVLRGGESISVWAEPGFEGQLAALAVAAGSDHPERLTRLRDKLMAEQERSEVKARAAQEKQREQAAAQRRSANKDLEDRLAINYGLRISGPLLLAIAIVGPMLPADWQMRVLLAGSVIACFPLVLDALLLPQFRQGVGVGASLEVPGTAFMIAGGIVVSFVFFMATDGDITPDESSRLAIALFMGASITAISTLWCMFGTRARRRSLAALAKAPPHPTPLADGVWGASDGVLVAGTQAASAGSESVVVAVGETAVSWGTATKGSNGVYSRPTSTSPFECLVREPELVTEHGRTVVRLGEASWISMVKLSQNTASNSIGDHSIRADVIGVNQPVRIAGRPRARSFNKQGEGSLLVFASASGTDVARELRWLLLRERVGLGLAVLGLACVPAAILRAIF